MDLVAADHVSPFADSGDILFAANLLSQSHNPQKLRPIRSIPPTSGYLLHPHSSHNLNPLEPSIQTHHHSVSGSGHVPVPPAMEFGSSLDDEDDDDDVGNAGNSSPSTKEFGSRKRRNKSERKLEGFVESMVKKVMEKQEQMHRELVEMLEKKERERIKREEAWKNKERERIKKDEEARAQERSRNLALISFIQKLLGHEIQIPQPVAEGSSKRDEGENEVNNGKDFTCDLSNNRWPDEEIQALITVRTSLDHKFRLPGCKGSTWDEISEAMNGMGYSRSAKKCKEKWENINKYYKRTVGNGKRLQNSKICPYFDELDILYRNGLLSLGNGLSNNNNVCRSEEKEGVE